MQTSKFTVIRNEQKIASLDLSRMNNALSFSKEDLELYFFQLSVIVGKHPEMQAKNRAFRFLLKQEKLQNVLTDLTEKRELLEKQWKNNLTDKQEITQRILELEQEIVLFNEMHFNVKKSYLRFVREHFHLSWQQSQMTA